MGPVADDGDGAGVDEAMREPLLIVAGQQRARVSPVQRHDRRTGRVPDRSDERGRVIAVEIRIGRQGARDHGDAAVASRDDGVVPVVRGGDAGAGERAHAVVAAGDALVERVVVGERHDVDATAQPIGASRIERELLAVRRSTGRQRTLEVRQPHVTGEQRRIGERRYRQRRPELHVARGGNAQRLGTMAAADKQRRCHQERC